MVIITPLNPDAETFSPQNHSLPQPPTPVWLHYEPQMIIWQWHQHFVYSPLQPHNDVHNLESETNLNLKWVPKKRPSLVPRGTTTLMIKNVPNQFKRRDLLDILDRHCRQENHMLKCSIPPPGPGGRVYRSKYNFAYLPMDFCRKANLGYAFVNFTNEEAATRFYVAFQNYAWEIPQNKKICQVTVARIQGFKALKSHFREVTYPYPTPSYLPVILAPPSDGRVSSKLITIGKLRL